MRDATSPFARTLALCLVLGATSAFAQGLEGVTFEAEALFFKYLRADGNRVGIDPDGGTDDVEFSHYATPRLTLGWVSAGGLGIRARYFKYDQSDQSLATGGAAATADLLRVDTYTIDLEFFERMRLNRNWDIELSGGVRYNEFLEQQFDASNTIINNASLRIQDFDGWGIIGGFQANRAVIAGSVYGRVRGALLTGDTVWQNETAATAFETGTSRDTIKAVTEFAIGYEINRDTQFGIFTMRAGYEYQLWANYSGASAHGLQTATHTIQEENFYGPADVGFHGFTFMLGLEL